MINYIPDINRFGAPEPPQWFLKAMWDQDAELVLLPSRIRRAYIIGRRRTKSTRVPLLVKADNTLQRKTRGTDADLLTEHGLVFIDWILGNLHNDQWTPKILMALKDRDTWAAGGADKYTDRLEAAEKKVAADKRKSLLDNMGHRAGDAWRSLQARTGRRNQHSNAGHKKAAKVVRVNMPHQPSSSTAGSGFSVDVGFVRDR